MTAPDEPSDIDASHLARAHNRATWGWKFWLPMYFVYVAALALVFAWWRWG